MAAPKISPSAKPNTVSATSAMTSKHPLPSHPLVDSGPPNLDHRSSGQPHEPHVGPTPSNPTPDPTPEPHDLLRIPDKKTIAKKAHLSAPSPLVLPRAVTAEAEIVSPISQTPSPPPSVLVAAAPPNHTSVFLAASQAAERFRLGRVKGPLQRLVLDRSQSQTELARLSRRDHDHPTGHRHKERQHARGGASFPPAPTATLPNSPASTATISIATKLSMSTAPIEAPRRHSFPASSVEPVRP
ncbi:hypothetical protein CcaverHIS002_0504640 [Cutaneotrichosporon cavernicola]|nr:hypothetical protein CcaverHIS002_0504640 [Cutaneotrichosporon cavernicola]